MKSVAVFLLLLGFCVLVYGALMFKTHQPQEEVKTHQIALKAQRERYNKELEKKRKTDMTLMAAGVIILIAGGVVLFLPKKKGAVAG